MAASLVWLLLLIQSFSSVDAYPEHRSSGLQGRQSITATSPFDHSWIEAFTSLGDSFSVGLGAGHYISAATNLELNTDCYQYSDGYPNLLNSNDMIGVNPNRKFQYLGCSGALVPSIKDNQVPKMSNAQLVTLSAGGNDANFATILNYCVFQWATWWPWTCNGQLASANSTINAQSYTDNLNSLIGAIKPKLQGANSRIYWVGYQRFWDTSTNQCDSVTWSFTRNYGFRQFLTQDLRNTMNSLVDNVNTKIKAVCDATPQCVFVDPTDSSNILMGRFCEPGVDESYRWPGGGVSANREETWAYEWLTVPFNKERIPHLVLISFRGTTKDDDTDDEKGIDQPQKRNDLPGNFNNASFEGAIAHWISLGQSNSSIDPTIAATLPANVTIQGSALPDSYGRVFHLDKFANGVVAMRILDAMDAEQAKMMNEPLVTTTISICSPVAAATPTLTAPATATICVGNQIEGSCVQGSLPSAAPDSAPLSPVCNKVDDPGNDLVRINNTQAEQASADYCADLIAGKIVLDGNDSSTDPGIKANAAENGGSLALSVMFDVDACPPGTSAQNQKLDFTQMSQEQCEQDLFTAISAECSQDSTWGDYNKDYTLEGGVVGLDCGLWALTGEPAS